jgi:hypothetical protein
MIDDTIPLEMAENIIYEVLSAFSCRKDRNQVGRALIAATVQSIERKHRGLAISTGLQNRINNLSKFANMSLTGIAL